MPDSTSNLRVIGNITEDISDAFGQITGAAETLEDGIDDVKKSFSGLTTSSEGAESSISALSRELISATGSMEATDDAVREVSQELRELGVSTKQAEEMLEQLNNENFKTSASSLQLSAVIELLEKQMDGLAEATDDAEDEMSQAARAAQALSISMGNLSLNVGAFTIAIRNLSTQIPVLVTTIGTAAAVVGGFTAALIAATVAITGLFAAGIIARAQEMKEEVAGITNFTEAMQEMMMQARDMILEAIEPLLTEDVGNFFEGIVEGILQTIRLFSEWLAMLLDNEGFQSFMDSLSELREGFRALMGAMTGIFEEPSDGARSLGQIFIDLSNAIMKWLADAIEFFDSILRDLTSGPLPKVLDQIKNFIRNMVELGSSILQGVLPVFGLFLKSLGEIAEMLNQLGSTGVQAIAFTLTLSFALDRLAAVIAILLEPLSIAAAGLLTFGTRANNAREAIMILTSGIRTFLTEWLNGIPRIANFLFGSFISGQAQQAEEGFEDTQDAVEAVVEELRDLKEEMVETTAGAAASAKAIEESFDNVSSSFDVDPSLQFTSIDDLIPEGRDIENIPKERMSGFQNVIQKEQEGISPNLRSTKIDKSDLPDGGIRAGPLAAGIAGGGSIRAGAKRGGDIDVPFEDPDYYSELKSRASSAFGSIKDAGSEAFSSFKTAAMPALFAFEDALWAIDDAMRATFKTFTDSEAFSQFSKRILGVIPTPNEIAGRLRGIKKGVLGLTPSFEKLASTTANAADAVIGFGSSIPTSRQQLDALAGTVINKLIPTLLSSIPASISAGTALNVAFLGIPALLTAIAALGGIVVGVLGNMQGAGTKVSNAFSAIKDVIGTMANALLPLYVDMWNAMVKIFEGIIDPITALFGGLHEIAVALGLAEEGGSGTVGVLQFLWSTFLALEKAIVGVVKIIGSLFNIIGSALKITIDLLAGSISFLIDVFSGLLTLLGRGIMKIPVLGQTLEGIIMIFNAFKQIITSIPSAFGNMISSVASGIERFVNNRVIPAINTLIGAVNKVAGSLPGVDKIGKLGQGGGFSVSDRDAGLKVSESDVRAGAQAVEEGGRDAFDSFAGGGSKPEFNFENKQSTNIEEVNADPEDKQGLKRIIKDAMKEANTLSRQDDAYSG